MQLSLFYYMLSLTWWYFKNQKVISHTCFSVDVKSQKAASAENFLRVNHTWRQLGGLEQDLEKLCLQVQSMKENFTNTTDNNLKLTEFSGSTI